MEEIKENASIVKIHGTNRRTSAKFSLPFSRHFLAIFCSCITPGKRQWRFHKNRENYFRILYAFSADSQRTMQIPEDFHKDNMKVMISHDHSLSNTKNTKKKKIL